MTISGSITWRVYVKIGETACMDSDEEESTRWFVAMAKAKGLFTWRWQTQAGRR